MFEDKVIAGTVIGCGVVLAGALGLIALDAMDEASEPGTGTVTGVEYFPSYTTTSCTTVGKVTTCTPITISECFEIRYEAPDGARGDACVDPYSFREYAVGDDYPKGN